MHGAGEVGDALRQALRGGGRPGGPSAKRGNEQPTFRGDQRVAGCCRESKDPGPQCVQRASAAHKQPV
eukprot:9633626-Lingulodinium_polyedra.AAC.1